MPRDVSDITLTSLAHFLSEETGISTGAIFLQYANDDYVNERTFQKFPSLGISEVGKTQIKYQNYGCKQIGQVNQDGSYKVYSPLGEKIMMIQIDLWCKTQKERRQYKNLIEDALVKNQYIPTTYANDPVTGEYLSLKFIDYELSDDKPFSAHFFIEVEASFFKEQDAFLVEQIEINSAIGFGLNPTGSWYESTNLNSWVEINPSGVFFDGEPGSSL